MVLIHTSSVNFRFLNVLVSPNLDIYSLEKKNLLLKREDKKIRLMLLLQEKKFSTFHLASKGCVAHWIKKG